MPYRRVDFIADEAKQADVEALVEDFEPVDVSTFQRGDEKWVFSVVVLDTVLEKLLEEVEAKYGQSEHFSLFVYDVSAILPRPEPEEEQASEQAAGDEEASGKSSNGKGFGNGLFVWKWPRISRDELLDDLEPASRVNPVYVAQVVISCVVAAMGMMQDSTAVVIAAMVIAPLLVPNMAIALGTTLGDLEMIRRAAITGVVGLCVGLLAGVIMGLVIVFDPSTGEIAARGQVRFSDVVVALSAGAAGALAVTTGVASGLIGVMVAVALVPPLVAVGLLLGAMQWSSAGAASVLLMTNVVCVNLAAVLVFLAVGIRPRTWYESDRAKKATRIAVWLWVALLVALILCIWVAQPDLPLHMRSSTP